MVRAVGCVWICDPFNDALGVAISQYLIPKITIANWEYSDPKYYDVL